MDRVESFALGLLFSRGDFSGDARDLAEENEEEADEEAAEPPLYICFDAVLYSCFYLNYSRYVPPFSVDTATAAAAAAAIGCFNFKYMAELLKFDVGCDDYGDNAFFSVAQQLLLMISEVELGRPRGGD